MTRYGKCGTWLLCLVLAAMAVGVPMAFGQDAEGATAAVNNADTQTMSWQWVIKSGGPLMYVLAAMSAVTLTLVMYFLVVLRTAQIAPLPLHRELVEKIKAGATDDARRACSYRPCPLSAVVTAALDYERSASDPILLKDVVEGEGGRQADAIMGQIQYLQDIAVISPMIGLLGTVQGMLIAFGSVAANIVAARPMVLAEGVSKALVTTAFGLIVGIPAMICYALFRRRASKLVSYLESASTDILTALMGERGPSEKKAEL